MDDRHREIGALQGRRSLACPRARRHPSRCLSLVMTFAVSVFLLNDGLRSRSQLPAVAVFDGCCADDELRRGGRN